MTIENLNNAKIPANVREELDLAKYYLEQGNEGKSRVCARRAVGFGIGARFTSDARYKGKNAMNLIKELRSDPSIPERVAVWLDEMVTRVDEKFGMPEHIDLIAGAEGLLTYLFVERDRP